MLNKLLRPLLIFLGLLLALQFFSGPQESTNSQDDITFHRKGGAIVGKEVQLTIRNHGDTAIIIPNRCPKNPLMVEEYVNGEWISREAEMDMKTCEKDADITLQPGESHLLRYKGWSWQLFNEPGRFRIGLTTTLEGKEKIYSHEINMEAPSFFRHIGREFFYKPILNALILFISILPHFSLGWGVIFLTLTIKLILLAPNHKALKAQKQMQKIQPELDALKRKYKDNPQKMTEETMRIWKKYKVNPMSSCLPLLIQFPILIALFYVVNGGLESVSPSLLYGDFRSFDLLKIDPIFLNVIDLTQINRIVLPLIVGGLQFWQMKITMGKMKPADPNEAPNPMVMMNKTMIYTMPLLIAVFTATMPAAVGLYWGTSTLFGLGQQAFINRSKD